jgi:hypothetical protein
VKVGEGPKLSIEKTEKIIGLKDMFSMDELEYVCERK